MRSVGIIGHPVAHSLSPLFQNAAFAHLGLDIQYQAWDTPEDALADRVASLRAPGTLGANVTIPHKEAVIPLLDEPADDALRIGAVNTIVNREGRLFGYNTDGPGFVRALQEANFEPRGRRVLLLGAGGAARGIAFALAEAGSRVAIWNRTAARAARLVEDVSALRPVAEVADTPAVLGYDCIVNCTSVGMEGTGTEAVSPAVFSDATPGTLAVDIVYKPAETAFLRAAAEAGLPTLGGLPMLIHQGALAFELWTGVPAPVAVMTAAAEEALAKEAGR